MSKVAIVTDSTSCLPKELAEEYGIRVVPLTFIFGNDTYQDDPALDMDEFYRRLEEEEKAPTTSPASPGMYLEVFRKLGEEADQVLCITVTAKISGMYEAARVASEMAAEELPNTKIQVMDSGTAAISQGFIALAAAKVAREGKGLVETVKAAEQVKNNVELVAMIDTLKYLAKSGRFPRIGVWAASAVGLKPILTLKEGHIRPITASRNAKRGMRKMIKLVEERTKVRGPLHLSIFHGNVPSKAEEFRKLVGEKLECKEVLVTRFTPVMGIYTGPGVLGLAYYSEKD